MVFVSHLEPARRYDKVLASKVFTFTPDYDYRLLDAREVIKGGTGYDIPGRLPEAVENSRMMDYSIYPEYPFSLQFFSRGCIRKCPFCLVREKEGYIQTVDPPVRNPPTALSDTTPPSRYGTSKPVKSTFGSGAEGSIYSSRKGL